MIIIYSMDSVTINAHLIMIKHTIDQYMEMIIILPVCIQIVRILLANSVINLLRNVNSVNHNM